MRWKRSFLLHLYVDTEEPKDLLGDLQAIPGRQLHFFKSETGLIDLLIRLTKALPQNPHASETPKRSETDPHHRLDPDK